MSTGRETQTQAGESFQQRLQRLRLKIDSLPKTHAPTCSTWPRLSPDNISSCRPHTAHHTTMTLTETITATIDTIAPFGRPAGEVTDDELRGTPS